MTHPSGDCIIRRVSEEFGAFSNMSPHVVWHEGLLWPRAEHLFQALRFAPDHLARERIRAEKNPMVAKMLAKTLFNEAIVAPRSPGDIDNMRLVLRLKYDQHAPVRRLLANTKDRRIVEDCTSRPSESGLFWGAAWEPNGGGRGQWRGANWLGRLWMELRDGRTT